MAKFTNLPDSAHARIDADLKYENVNCRYYFAACIRQIRRKLGEMKTTNDVDQDYLAARCLQGLVMRHFMLSCLDCRRRSPSRVSPCFWSVDGVTLCLYMPSAMGRKQRRTWLNSNVTDIDPRRPGERQRVQEIIDRLIVHRGRIRSVDAVNPTPEQPARSLDSPENLVAQMASQGLARTVAEEKARNIAKQRPAIRALGAERLAELVRRIFEDLECSRYEDGRVARAFNLSPASFSRFAGSRWARESWNEGTSQIPDLWRNTAQVIAMHPDFLETAREAGVWRTIQKVLNRDSRATKSGVHA